MVYTGNSVTMQSCTFLLPDRLRQLEGEQGTLCLFDTDSENEPAAVLFARLRGENIELLWLFTSEASRGQGLATALLQRLVLIARRLGGVESVTAALPTDSAALPFFLDAGFTAAPEPDVEFTTTVGALAGGSLWRRPPATDDIVPLSELSNAILSVFEQRVREQGNPAALPLPLKKAVYLPELSFAAICGGKVAGVLLCERAEDGISLSGLHVVSGGGEVLSRLLSRAGTAATQAYPPETPLHILTVNETSQKLVSRLLANTSRRYACRLALPVGPAEEDRR